MVCLPGITYGDLISSYCVVKKVGQQETPVSSTQQLLWRRGAAWRLDDLV